MKKIMAEDKENKVTQLRKGILELAVMSTLFGDSHYGYSLVRRLAETEAIDIREGTIYPILARLSREGLVKSRWVESNQGPPRKYYELTSEGRATCGQLLEEFDRLVRLVRGAGVAVDPLPESRKERVLKIRRTKDEQ